jgi:ABC-type transport system involved in multi-copper enzyme maturation permease subunit
MVSKTCSCRSPPERSSEQGCLGEAGETGEVGEAGPVAMTVNPVLRRELVERMRARSTFVVLTIYLAVLSASLYLAYQSGRSTARIEDLGPDGFGLGPGAGASLATEVATVGRGIFEWLLFFMLLLVLFLVPGQTAGAIAGERERQTLVPLQLTLLRPRSIVLGKIGAALSFLVLLVVAAVPLLAVTYLIGGVSIGEVLGGTLLVLFVGLVVGCMAAAISAFVRRVQVATVLSYAMVLGLVLGTLAVQAAAGAIDTSRGIDDANPPGWLLLPNPLATVTGAVDDGDDAGPGDGEMTSPFDAIEDRLREGSSRSSSGAVSCQVIAGPGGPNRELCFDEVTGEELAAPDDLGDGTSGGFWWQSSFLLAALGALAVVAAARRLRTPAGTER